MAALRRTATAAGLRRAATAACVRRAATAAGLRRAAAAVVPKVGLGAPCYGSGVVGSQCKLGRAARSCSASAADPVGLGYVSDEITGASYANLFKAMMRKIDGPEHFLPVSHVSVRMATELAAAEQGALWRSMRFDGDGPLHGATVREHIYASKIDGEIRFVALDEAGRNEGELEVVNALHREPLRIEYYQRRVLTRERVPWAAPRASAAGAIEATVALARAAEAAAARVDQFSPKA